MNCIVTAGPTYEPLDEVRRLTNFSTGRLGSELANFLTARGHGVTLLIGEPATWPGERRAGRIDPFTTTADLRARLQAMASAEVDAVFHAAAVSDFRFGKVWQRAADGQLAEVTARKIPTRMDSLLVELWPTEKIILRLRAWFPHAWLVGWKYEMDGNRAEAIAQAARQIRESRTHACVANGRAYGDGFGIVAPDESCAHVETMETLFPALEMLARSACARRRPPATS
jgi:phosphopantothenoylcysteine decarboxylase/phosphopantothenate--cysteine ligase